jgi:hypothetical protein
MCYTMRLKSRGLVQHGGPPGWLEESDSEGVIWNVMDRTVGTGGPDRSCPDAS